MRVIHSIIIIFLAVGLSQFQPSGAVCCLHYWTLRGNRCYRYIGKSRNWHAAQSYCNGLDYRANLVSLNNQDEAEFIYHLFAEKGGWMYSGHWIGLNDISREGTFKWVGTNAAMTYSNWDHDQPDDYRRSEDCGEIYNRAGFWNDIGCTSTDEHQPFICEMPVPAS